MNNKKIIFRIAQLGFILLLAALSSCRQSAPLEVDAVEKDTAFTFSPIHGYPGTTVKITGSDLGDVLTVSFGSKQAPVESQSDGEIIVEVPLGGKTGKIVLAKETSAISSLVNFVVDDDPIPTIMDFSPAIVGRRDSLIINGSLLDMVESVTVGEEKLTILSKTSNQLIVNTGRRLETGFIDLHYKYFTSYGMEQEGVSSSTQEVVLKLPTISSITPDVSKFDIGDTVTITGSMFESLNEIFFDQTEAEDFEVISDEELWVVIPMGFVSGSIRLVVDDGETASSELSINFPTISSFLPGKGEKLEGDTRQFSVVGTNFSLVTGVQIGGEDATIIEKSNNLLTFIADATYGGKIGLVTENGTHLSSEPFLLSGDFFVNDWDETYVPNRFWKFANNNTSGLTVDTINDAGDNYVQLSLRGPLHNKSFYLWAPEGEALGYDRFSLFTSNPEGVYVEFDLKVTDIDAAIATDDSLVFKLFMMDSRGWDATGEFAYGANGPQVRVTTSGEWQHFSFHLNDFLSSNNAGLYNVSQTDGITINTSAWLHPNSLRIMSFVFGTAGEDEEQEGNAVIGLNNLKFSIR